MEQLVILVRQCEEGQASEGRPDNSKTVDAVKKPSRAVKNELKMVVISQQVVQSMQSCISTTSPPLGLHVLLFWKLRLSTVFWDYLFNKYNLLSGSLIFADSQTLFVS